MSRSTKLYAALAASLFVFIGLALALSRPGLIDYKPHLSFSPDVDGAKGLKTLMAREGADAREWRLPPDRLPEGSGQLWIAIEPAGFTAEAADLLRAWAERGNDVVVFAEWPGMFAEWEPELPVENDSDGTDGTDSADGAGDSDRADGADGADSTDEAADFELNGGYRLMPTEAGAGAETVAEDEYGVLASRLTLGEGSLSVAVMPEWTRNDTILEQTNFETVWDLLGAPEDGRIVYFDEYHHGYSTSPGLLQVYPAWLLAGIAQLALGGVAWLWLAGKRFGPAYTPRAFRVRRGDETLLAVAGWYRHGKLTAEALDHRVEALKRRLQTRGNVPADAGAAELLTAVRRTLEAERVPAALPAALEHWEQLRLRPAADSRERKRQTAAYTERMLLADSDAIDETLRRIGEAL